jgi:subtilisin family serine protease/subtilisin-like proprotein convertase family protein
MVLTLPIPIMKTTRWLILAVAALLAATPTLSAAPAPEESTWIQAVERMGSERSFAPLLDQLYVTPTLRLRHQGQTRNFTLAVDEFALRFSRNPSWVDAEALLPLLPPGTKVSALENTYAVYQLPRRLEASDFSELSNRWNTTVSQAIGQARAVRGISPVLYLQDRSAAKNADGTPAPPRPSMQRVFVGNVLTLVRPENAPALTPSAFAAPLRPRLLSTGEAASRIQNVSFPTGFEMLAAVKDLDPKLTASGWTVEPDLTQLLQLYASLTPNDPLFPSQWHLLDSSPTNINVQQAWGEGLTGAGLNISIVDTGLDLAHEDLDANTPAIGTNLHRDVLGGTNDPSPQNAEENHGTACAGLAAAVFNNNIGVSGSAPGAGLLGIRIFAGAFGSLLDTQTQTALGWTAADISSNSWGPVGAAASGPGINTASAIQSRITSGRGGKGTIFLFAGGNGDQEGAYNGYNGYATNPFTITIAAVGPDGKKAFYSELGPNITVSAPTQGTLSGLASTTTDRMGAPGYDDGNYTSTFNGTSAATPIVAGVVALMLEANPDLGWRDVKEILIRTAQFNDPTDTMWATNGAGFRFNEKYGAGLVNATAAVALARTWTNLKPEVTRPAAAFTLPAVRTLREGLPPVVSTVAFSDRRTNVRVESVQVSVKVTHSWNGDLEWFLTSPSGKRVMLGRRNIANSSDDLDWTFTTNHFWGEDSIGTWTLSVQDVINADSGTLDSASLILRGSENPLVTRPVFSVPTTLTAPETIGTLKVNVSRSGLTAPEVTVDYAVIPGTATDGADYVGSTGTLTFAAGEIVKTIDIPILNEDDEEPAETFFVILSNPTGGGPLDEEKAVIREPGQCVVTIPANDSVLARFEAATYTVFEGQLTANFVIERIGNADKAGYVHYVTEDGTARYGVDYTVPGKRVLFLSGQRRAIVPIVIPRNATLDGPRTFRVHLTRPDGKTDTAVAGSIADVEIND